MTYAFPVRVPMGIDIAELQTHAPALLWQKPMPGVVANAKYQHLAQLWSELERIILAIVTPQYPEAAFLIGPLLAESHQYTDDLVF